MIVNRRSLLALLSLLAAVGCTPTVANRGHLVDPDKMAEIKVGESTRENVATILGTPSQIGTFDENVWYYFGRKTEQYSFLNPDVIKQQAVEVRFNDEGVVTEMKTLDPKLAEDISPAGDKTPTYGHETTVFEQLLGNIGRPTGNAKDSKK